MPSWLLEFGEEGEPPRCSDDRLTIWLDLHSSLLSVASVQASLGLLYSRFDSSRCVFIFILQFHGAPEGRPRDEQRLSSESRRGAQTRYGFEGQTSESPHLAGKTEDRKVFFLFWEEAATQSSRRHRVYFYLKSSPSFFYARTPYF